MAVKKAVLNSFDILKIFIKVVMCTFWFTFCYSSLVYSAYLYKSAFYKTLQDLNQNYFSRAIKIEIDLLNNTKTYDINIPRGLLTFSMLKYVCSYFIF